MATLTYKLFATPGRSYHRAHYTVVHKNVLKSMTRAFFLLYCCSSAHKCLSRRPHAAAAGGRGLAAAIFFILYIYY